MVRLSLTQKERMRWVLIVLFDRFEIEVRIFCDNRVRIVFVALKARFEEIGGS